MIRPTKRLTWNEGAIALQTVNTVAKGARQETLRCLWVKLTFSHNPSDTHEPTSQFITFINANDENHSERISVNISLCTIRLVKIIINFL